MKNRRKKELAEDKKQRMATGGSPYIRPPEDYQTDNILNGVDIEITDTVDSDGIALEAGISENDIHHHVDPETHEEEIHIVVENGTPSRSQSEATLGGNLLPIRKPKTPSYTSRGTAIERELEVRLQGNRQMQQHEEELHALRVHEQRLKNEEQELRVAEQKIRNEIALYELEIVKNKMKNVIT